MIGNDEIDPTPLRGLRGGERPDAGIHADDGPNAAIGGLLDHFIAHAVAFANAVGDVVVNLAAANLQRGL